MSSSIERISGELNELLTQPEAAPAPAPAVLPELPVGIHEDIPIETYLALPYMNAGRLEKLRRSPLQYRHSLTEPPTKTAALERGTALHLAVLEPHLFTDRYIVLGQCEGMTAKKDRCRYQGSVYRDGRSYCGTHDPGTGTPLSADIEVISAKDYDAVLGMATAISAHPRACGLFEGRGLFEATVIFDDPETGMRCKCRPDRLIDRARMNVDVKTTFDAAPWAFPRQAENLGYFRKLSWYRRALRTIGWDYEMTTVLAIESAAPYDLVCYLMDESSLDSADAEMSRLMRQYVRCMESDTWPGYADDLIELQRPAWAQNGV
jgi:hypothetical protein